jgi:DNA-binding NtrC family response regulator
MVIEAEGYEVRTALIGTRGEEIFKQRRPDVVVTDLMLPDLDGVSLLRRLKEIDPWPEIIVISGQGTIARAVEAGQAGAFYFLEKPVSQDGLMNIVGRAIDRTQERAEHQQLKEQIRGQYSFANIVGQSKKMKELFELVESVAASDANILIQGENGTGKELIANAIHYNSNRVKGPFIKINCAAIPKDLIESELFGYKKGAFTGANTDKVGLFEMSESGSLLLDEIGEMPVPSDRSCCGCCRARVRPIGSDRLVHVDFRLIARPTSISKRRSGKASCGKTCISALTDHSSGAPLRERTEDIPLLCNHFLSKFNQRYQKSVRSISPAAYHLLIRNRWAGNVRELETPSTRHARVQECRDHPERSSRDDPGREKPVAGVHDSSAPNPRGNRENGDRPDAAANQLEQAGGSAGPRSVSAHALQQDEEARHPGSTRRATGRRRLVFYPSRSLGIRDPGSEFESPVETRIPSPESRPQPVHVARPLHNGRA